MQRKRAAKPACRKRRANAGWFKSGPDPRRNNNPPNRSQCAKGWRTTMERHPHLGLWLFLRIKQTCPRERRAGR